MCASIHFCVRSGMCTPYRSIHPVGESAATWYRDDEATPILSREVSERSDMSKQGSFTHRTRNTTTSKPHSLLPFLLLGG